MPNHRRTHQRGSTCGRPAARCVAPRGRTGLSGGDALRVPEQVARVVAVLHLLQPWVVALVVQRLPRHAGGVPGRVTEVDVGVVDVAAVGLGAGYGYAAGRHEHVPVEPAYPGEVRGVGTRVGPRGDELRFEDRVALHGGRGRSGHGVDGSAVSGDDQQRAGVLVVGRGQVAVDGGRLIVGEPLLQVRRLDLVSDVGVTGAGEAVPLDRVQPRAVAGAPTESEQARCRRAWP